MALSEEMVHKYSDVALSKLNKTIGELRRVFLVEDLVDSIKVRADRGPDDVMMAFSHPDLLFHLFVRSLQTGFLHKTSQLNELKRWFCLEFQNIVLKLLFFSV